MLFCEYYINLEMSAIITHFAREQGVNPSGWKASFWPNDYNASEVIYDDKLLWLISK